MRTLGTLLGALILLLPACASDEPEPSAVSEAAPVDEGVCLTLVALDNDLEGGREEFMARAHDGLHELASRLLDQEERSLAGDLLEAKQFVEAAFEQPLPTKRVRDFLVALHRATQSALEALGESTSPCPQAK